MLKPRILLLSIALCWPGIAASADPHPQPAQPMPSEHRLSPDEIEQVLADAARKREQARQSAGQADLSEDRLPPPIQGEVGFSIGTGGYRSAFGTAIVPLPGNGAAAFSFETDRFKPRELNRRGH